GSAGHGTAWMEWRWIRAVAADGVDCVRPVAFGESMRGRRERFSAVVTEAVPGESLERWAERRMSRCPRWMVVALAEFVRRFHERGYVHRDLYLAHIFFDASAKRTAAFRLIDLQRVRKPVWRRRRWRVKDLAALAYSTPRSVATPSDRVRFLRRYLGVRRLGPEGKRLVGAIAAKRARIARHDERRRRGQAGSGGPDAELDR
ncbi:MAG: lipopolysaccharide kinase InaA family protein, partial [Phycisphaerae bacterium]